ncbi:MAG: hypothetical protein FJ126_13090 [Deltaproteobacteria bacterium]|nr:hypothetical protein [Deltaproteobacteria bacterium]
MEKAVVIKGATNSRDGIAAEYAYLEKRFGKRNVDWKLKRQSLRHHQGKHFDFLEIELKDGSPKEVFFDITEFFGKF